MGKKFENDARGFTIAELMVTIVVFAIISLAAYQILIAYISASSQAQLRSVALGIATEQIEYLRSLPYDRLAIQGGSIISSGTLIPPNTTIKRGGRDFIVTTAIKYVDDAYDGCLVYSAPQAYLCRNGPAKTGLPADNNPRDYKLGDVTVKDKASGQEYASLSTQFTSRVAETAGNSTAISVTVIDTQGNKVSDATVTVKNMTTSPNVDQSMTTDAEGNALFLDVIPDNNPDYVITASKLGYSTLTTIAASSNAFGPLTPTYPNVNGIVQQVSNSTLTIGQVSSSSLSIHVVDGAGNPLSGFSVTVVGGIKLYTNPADTTYSYSQASTTDASGNILLGNLVPGMYTVCSAGALCSSGKYPATVTVSNGSNSYQPFIVPEGSGSLMQSIEIVSTTNANAPRIKLADPSSFSVSDADASNSEVVITGSNLSGATATLKLGGVSITGTQIGTDSATSITRSFNLSGASVGLYDLVVQTANGTAVQHVLTGGKNGGVNATP